MCREPSADGEEGTRSAAAGRRAVGSAGTVHCSASWSRGRKTTVSIDTIAC